MRTATIQGRITHWVLIVDDNDSVREALASLLNGEGFAVVSARNGKEALEALHHSSPPCSIILDLNMPVMDGWEFRSEEKNDACLAQIPVIVVTALSKANIDADLILQKPVRLARLLEAVRAYC